LDLAVFDKEVKRKQKANQETYEQWKEKYQCDEKEDVLYHHKALVVMDDQIHQKILCHYHDSLTVGHPGVWKTLTVVQKDYWWPTMRQYIAKYVKGCTICQQNKTITHQN